MGVFGPRYVRTRKTKGRRVNAKRWTVIYCCMATRGTIWIVYKHVKNGTHSNVNVGDIVLLKDAGAYRNHWLLAKSGVFLSS